MFNVSTLLLDNALKLATPLKNDAIIQTLQQLAHLWFTSLSDDHLLQLVDCCKLSTLINHLWKGPQTVKSTRFKFGLFGAGPLSDLINVDHAIG